MCKLIELNRFCVEVTHQIHINTNMQKDSNNEKNESFNNQYCINCNHHIGSSLTQNMSQL